MRRARRQSGLTYPASIRRTSSRNTTSPPGGGRWNEAMVYSVCATLRRRRECSTAGDQEVPEQQMARRILSTIVVAAVAGGLTFCGGSPSALSTPPSAGRSVVSIRIVGPTTLAPRGKGTSIAQFTATATMNDGSTADFTATASWSTSHPDILHTTAKPGEMQAEDPGDVVVTAKAGDVTASLNVRVFENGTFTITGTVTDNATGRGLKSVIVRILPTRRSVATDANGRYSVAGAVGATEITASAWGFASQTRTVDVTGAATQDFVLAPELAPADVSGNWSMALSASPTCRERLPEAARDRQYDAVITQQSARIFITITNASVFSSCSDPLPYVLPGAVIGDRLESGITGDTGYTNFSSVCFGDR